MEKYFVAVNYNLVFHGLTMIENLNIDLQTSCCLLGESGSGKTTLLKSLLKNKNYDTNGTVSFYLKERLLFQNIDIQNYDEETISFLKKFFKRPDDYKYALWTKIKNIPDFLFCDELNLDNEDFILFLNFLKVKNIKIFYVTKNVEQTIYFDYLYVLKNNQIAIEGTTESVLKEEKLMKLLGYSIPFYVNLSKQLGYYGLSHKICYNKEDLEESLWPSI